VHGSWEEPHWDAAVTGKEVAWRAETRRLLQATPAAPQSSQYDPVGSPLLRRPGSSSESFCVNAAGPRGQLRVGALVRWRRRRGGDGGGGGSAGKLTLQGVSRSYVPQTNPAIRRLTG
jgi:hypothetical protein